MLPEWFKNLRGTRVFTLLSDGVTYREGLKLIGITLADGSEGGLVAVGNNANAQPIKGRFVKLDGAGTIKLAEFQAGSKISNLYIYPRKGTAATLNGDEYVILTIDPLNFTDAQNALNQVESLTSDIGWIPVPLNEVTKIPLGAYLQNGQFGGGSVGLKTVGGAAIDVFVGGN